MTTEAVFADLSGNASPELLSMVMASTAAGAKRRPVFLHVENVDVREACAGPAALEDARRETAALLDALMLPDKLNAR